MESGGERLTVKPSNEMRRKWAIDIGLATGILLISVVAAQTQPTHENLLHVEITGLHSDKGKVLCALFSSADGFPKNTDKAAARSESVIARGHAACDFSVVSPSTYAVSAFHDENSNGKLDTNFIGIPREGVGSSNDAKGHLGPPKFNAAAFRFAGGRLDLEITIRYLEEK